MPTRLAQKKSLCKTHNAIDRDNVHGAQDGSSATEEAPMATSTPPDPNTTRAGGQLPPHTPGPWRVEYEPYCHVRSDAGCVLAADYTTDENAALIAAAPDLLAALQEMTAAYATGRPIHADIDTRARAAIAKAEGRA
jgi:hypothetical protein